MWIPSTGWGSQRALVPCACILNPTDGDADRLVLTPPPTLLPRTALPFGAALQMFVPNLVMTTALGSACLIAANKMK